MRGVLSRKPRRGGRWGSRAEPFANLRRVATYGRCRRCGLGDDDADHGSQHTTTRRLCHRRSIGNPRHTCSSVPPRDPPTIASSLIVSAPCYVLPGTGQGKRRPEAVQNVRDIDVSDNATTPTDPTAPSGERRQVTAMFADMVGFTAIAERLGEEGTFALIRPIFEMLTGAVASRADRSRTSPATASWRCSACPRRSRTRRCAPVARDCAIHERLAAAAPAIKARYGVRPKMRVGINSGIAVVTQIGAESAI